MSGVAGLYNVASIQSELDTWAFVHAAHHRDVNRVIFQLTGQNLEEAVLDPLDPQKPDDWLQNHQIMHQQVNALLGISGYNLLVVDMTDPSQFSNWVFLNADEHMKMANILGIG